MSQHPQHIEPQEGWAEDVPVPMLLLPYQQRWVADTSPVKICEKSRRIGISWAEAADSALHAATRREEGGGHVSYLAYEKEMTRTFIDDVAWFAKQYGLAASAAREVVFDEEKDVKAFRIDFDSGNYVQALSSSPRNLRSKGKPGDRAILDEFAFHDETSELLKAAMALLIWGGSVRIISTHNGAANPFARLIEECHADKKPYSVHTVPFRQAVGEGLYRRICLVTGKEYSKAGEEQWVEGVYDFYGADAEEELDTIPSQSSGAYFNKIEVEACTSESVPVIRKAFTDEFAQLPDAEQTERVEEWCERELGPYLQEADSDTAPSGWPTPVQLAREAFHPLMKSCLGLDFARTGHLTVMVPAQIQQDLTRRALFMLELRNAPFDVQRQILFFICDRLPRFIHATLDATGNGSYLGEKAQQRYGESRVTALKLNDGFYLEAMPRYKAGIESRKVLLAADSDVVDDHLDVQKINGVAKVPKSGERKGSADGGKRHGDAAIASMLMWHASEQQSGEIDFETLGRSPEREALEAFTGAQEAAIHEDRGWGTVGGSLSDLGGFR